MSEDEPGGTPDELARRLRETADRLTRGWTDALRVGPPALPGLPAALSARQLQIVMDDIAARRAQVQALRTQLEAFDQQLGSLETNLRPLLEWAHTWADLEKAVTSFWRPPHSGQGSGADG
ncbi:hypothetical protein [Pseudonocardia asaccharolytica]|nr:hypothetical protein [Pseudonocardia asaccharolytica]